jgi:hypothetical protein
VIDRRAIHPQCCGSGRNLRSWPRPCNHAAEEASAQEIRGPEPLTRATAGNSAVRFRRHLSANKFAHVRVGEHFAASAKHHPSPAPKADAAQPAPPAGRARTPGALVRVHRTAGARTSARTAYRHPPPLRQFCRCTCAAQPGAPVSPFRKGSAVPTSAGDGGRGYRTHVHPGRSRSHYPFTYRPKYTARPAAGAETYFS